QMSPGKAGIDWRILLVWTGMATAAALLVFNLAAGAIIPPLVVFAALYGVGVWLARRGGKAGPIMLGILSLLLIGVNVPFIVPALSVPASTVDFVMTGFLVVLALANLVSSVALLRGADAGSARFVGRSLVALVLVVVAVAIAGRVTYDAPVSQSGDIELAAQDYEFNTEVIEADSGEVSVFVENKDAALHTFTVEGLDVDLQVPGGTTARVTFEATAGSYEFICEPHSDVMKGTLEVQ
ncbi:MAG: cupredoxin domain-containing protein, partial [Actinomycetota bacterium]|nr:cupredoxin domain-containing protein [Actinomycetota bacterium]